MEDKHEEMVLPVEKPAAETKHLTMTVTKSDHEAECLSRKDDCPIEEQSKPISKNQQKKMRRLAAKLKHRSANRQLERQRRKDNRRKAKEAGIDLQPDRKRLRRENKDTCNMRVVIDASYDEYMTEDESKKLLKQIQHCYAINRRTDQPFKYSLTSFTGKTADRLHSLEGTSTWQIEYEKKCYTDLYDSEQIVFLSAESENTLEKLEENAVYIIGGLVDHNRHKGLCHRLAQEKNIKTAKLPISDFIDMKSRRVLTVDHVFEILVRFKEQQDWEAAFFQVIPKRKGIQCLQADKLTESEGNKSEETKSD